MFIQKNPKPMGQSVGINDATKVPKEPRVIGRGLQSLEWSWRCPTVLHVVQTMRTSRKSLWKDKSIRKEHFKLGGT